MAARSNALSEITRFWLQARHGCLVDEAIPVKVPFGNSDIDLVAVRPDLRPWTLPDGVTVTRAIIETKDEHDFDPAGRDFAARLLADISTLGDGLYIPMGQKAKFTMLRQEHYEKAVEFFGTRDFDRLFVVHALEPQVRQEACTRLASEKRVHWLTVREVVSDLYRWYQRHTSKATLRNSLMGDLWHLLIGYCAFRPAAD
jgi:hypothetical protein